MDLNRRSLLKLFGAGAAVVPLIAEMPRLDAAARLVEPARVEIIEKPLVTKPGALSDLNSLMNRNQKVTVTVYVDAAGEHYRFEAEAFVARTSVQIIDVASYGDSPEFRQFAPGLKGDVTFALYGVPMWEQIRR